MPMLFEDLRRQLEEKLLILGGGKKYEQAVILAGGAGSGKSYATQHFIQGENYKIINVDDMKEMLAKLAKSTTRLKMGNKLDEILPTIRNLDLKNADDTSKLHAIVKDLGLDDKQLFYILGNPGGMRSHMPNLMFDMTLKSEKSAREITSILLNGGYKPENIHIVWVLTDYKMALRQNYNRSRRVFNDVLFDTHIGAKQTMTEVVFKNYDSLGINGDIAVIIGGPPQKYAPDLENKQDMRKTNTGAEWAKDFTYIRVKKVGNKTIDQGAVDQVLRFVAHLAPPQKNFDKSIGSQYPQTNR